MRPDVPWKCRPSASAKLPRDNCGGRRDTHQHKLLQNRRRSLGTGWPVAQNCILLYRRCIADLQSAGVELTTTFRNRSTVCRLKTCDTAECNSALRLVSGRKADVIDAEIPQSERVRSGVSRIISPSAPTVRCGFLPGRSPR